MKTRLLVLIIVCLASMENITAWDCINKIGDAIALEVCQEKDLQHCESIFIKAFSKAYESFTVEELGISDKLSFLKEAFSEVYQDFNQGLQTLVIAIDNGQIIGFSGFKTTDMPRQLYISQLAVDPDYWNQGIGQLLVFSSLALFEDTTSLVVIPRKINVIAQKFYEKIGFTPSCYMHPGYNPAKYTGYEWSKSN
jgi:GNAT superfamily N-acetyltransferase